MGGGAIVRISIDLPGFVYRGSTANSTRMIHLTGTAYSMEIHRDIPVTSQRTVKQRIVKRRDRKIHSCTQCRARKLKCDKGHPCFRCQESKASCVYVDNALELEKAPQRVVKRRRRVITVCWTCRERKIPCDKGYPCTACRDAGFECIYKRFEDDKLPTLPATSDRYQVRTADEAESASQLVPTQYENSHLVPMRQHVSQDEISIPDDRRQNKKQAYHNLSSGTCLHGFPVVSDFPSVGHTPHRPAAMYHMNPGNPVADNEGYDLYPHPQSLPSLREMLSRRVLRGPKGFTPEEQNERSHAVRNHHDVQFKPLAYNQLRYYSQSNGLDSYHYPVVTATPQHFPFSPAHHNFASNGAASHQHNHLIQIDAPHDRHRVVNNAQPYGYPITFQHNHIPHHSRMEHHESPHGLPPIKHSGREGYPLCLGTVSFENYNI